MPRKNSPPGRKQRWTRACNSAQLALSTARIYEERLKQELDQLIELQDEYGTRHDTLPQNLRNSKLAKKLEDLKSLPLKEMKPVVGKALDEVEQGMNEVCATPLPGAFGKD